MAFDPALLAILTEHNLGTLATLKRDGRPQLSNVNYHFDPDRMLVRISLTDDRAKVKNLRRDPRASMLVQSHHGWVYAVAEGDVELSDVTTRPDDEAMDELIEVYRDVAGKEHPDWDDYRRAMIADRRLVARFTVTHVYGKVS
jgi:PPOX class probable F420-dependent enzyme